MNNLKAFLNQHGALFAMFFFCVTVPIVGGFMAYTPAPTQVTLQAAEPTPGANLNDLVPVMQLIAQRQSAPGPQQPVQQAETLQPIRDPMIEAINRMDRNHRELLQQIVERDKKMSEQLSAYMKASISTGQKQDRSGNTKAQLQDIYSDANVPDLPDPMVKALAANPGSRMMIHPDHGQPVNAVTEWGVTNYGGGKQLTLIRHKGKMYGQTIMHGNGSNAPAASPPAPEPFRLSLGNN